MNAPWHRDGWRSLALVVSREIREALRRKAVWIATGVALTASVALMILPSLLGSSGDNYQVALLGSHSDTLDGSLIKAGRSLDIDIELTAGSDDEAARVAVRNGELDAAVVLTGLEPRLITAQGTSPLTAALRQGIAEDHAVNQLRDAGLESGVITAALDPPPLTLDLVDTDRSGRVAAASVVALAVYLLLLTVTMQVANGVAIEKANRVSEVLLAIVSPVSLLFGKVIGVMAMALLPVAAGATPIVIRLATSGGLPPDTGTAVAAGAAWFTLGAGFYVLAAAALGSLVERQEEAGSSLAGLSVVLIASYIIGQSAADSPVGAVLAWVPFSSPMVEPARLALGVSSPTEIIGSLAVSAASVMVMARASAAIYGRAVVRTGQRLHLRDVLG